MAGGAAQELCLPENPHAPLLGFIGRLDEQKGVDLIRDNFEWLMGEGAQLVLLGSGRDDLQNSLRCRALTCPVWWHLTVWTGSPHMQGSGVLESGSGEEAFLLQHHLACMFGSRVGHCGW